MEKTNIGYLESLLSSREREITQEELMAGNRSQTNSFGKQGTAFECSTLSTSSSALLYFSVGGCLWRASIAQAQVPRLSLREPE